MNHLTILRTIAKHQPIMASDLHSAAGQGVTYRSFVAALTELVELGLINKNRHKGPVWLTVRGREKLDDNFKL